MMDAWMLFKRGAGLQAGVTAEIVGDDEEIPSWIVSFDVGKPRNVAFGVA